MAKLCMGCMNPLPEGDDTCSVCGFARTDTNPEGYLPVATVLQEHYIVGRRMSEGSDSVLYIGYDRLLKEPCFVQEFYPGGLCARGEDGSVQPLGGCERPFGEYMEEFRTTMRTLARVKDLPNIIPVYDIFEENGTVYAVSDYCAGVTLTKKVKQAGGRLPWSEARALFMSLLTCVSQLHSARIRHLAICPDNIIISADGKAHLRNFAIPQAHCVGGDLTPDLPAGFAAPEQYDMSGAAAVGDATDVYGLAATLFYTVTGNLPPAGNKRAKDSDDLFMSADVAQELSQPVCVALFNALLVSPEERTGTVAELRDQLGIEPNVSALIDEAAADRADQEDEEDGKGNKRTLLFVFIAVVAALLVVGGVMLVMLFGGTGGNNESEVSTPAPPTLTTTTTTQKQATKYSVENLLGKSFYDLREETLKGEMTVVVESMRYSDKAKGTIIAQNPAAGTTVDKKQTISVVISAGKNDEVKVPDLAGWKQEHATLYLEALGFKVDLATLQISDYDKGLVDSTDPVPGTVKHVGDTITLRVSNVEKVEEPAPDDTLSTDDTSVVE